MAFRSPDWIAPDERGLYVRPGDFYIDPAKPAARAVISHAHSDHARPGNGEVWATPDTLGLMRIRYGRAAGEKLRGLEEGRSVEFGPVRVTLVPAGHVLGSAQVVLDHGGCRVVYTGDYKRRADPTCRAFETVPCDVLITEATFGLPVFRHPDPDLEIAKLLDSMRRFPERAHVVGVYALGKCQRLLALLREAGFPGPVRVHGALEPFCRFYEAKGLDLGGWVPVREAGAEKPGGALVLAPPGAVRETWAGRHDPVAGFASGWMAVRQRAKQRNAELPLVVSDHADWPDLLRTIGEAGCREVWVTHGQEDALVHVCRQRGLAARPLSLVGFEEEGG